ncbi:MAG: hypothetical protein DDT37_01451 [Firmicutes bacterium]|nr:hypothetical protein [candidate division NPL-UPA2 bacterium]MBT9156465.1 hypothetical protein [candidate division NPL-UPA2 bacterium]
MKLNRREVVLVSLLGLALAGAAFYLLFWQPLAAERAALEYRLRILTRTLDRLAPWETKEAELKTRIADIKEQIHVTAAERELGIPLPEFLVMLENAARATFVRLESTSIAVGDIGAVTTLQLTGTYHDLYRLLMLLEAQDEALVLETLRFAGGAEGLTASLQVRLFSGAVIGEPKVGGFPERSPFVPRRN